MRVIFMGTPEFAVPTLEGLVNAGHEIVLVVSQPDKKKGRGQQMQSPPVAVRARELGLSLSQPRAIRSGSFPKRVCSLEADVAVVIAYGRILTQELLNAPRLGCVNVHASLLPRWRGPAPIQYALLAGDRETGVCTQQMEEGLDTGPLFVSRRVAVADRETAGSLHDRLALLSAEVAVETLQCMERTEPTPQLESEVTWTQKIGREDGRLNWQESANSLDQRVRAMTPWPGGWVPRADQRLKVLEVALAQGTGSPGTVLECAPGLVIACGEGALELVRVQAPGRRPVSGRDFANGAHLAPGGTL